MKTLHFEHIRCMGRTRNFHLERLTIFSHDGAIHDTIVSAERHTPP